jgi:pimeloyl-ACP methyl ester carboxylesterase
MSEGHSERLVYTETEDGYVLEGAQFSPTQEHAHAKVVVWMHGFTGHFHEQHTVRIGRRLADRGHTFVTGNNRGHDLGANVHRVDGAAALQAGAWWENVAECRFDFSAWIGFGVQLAGSRVVLAGHSLGAYKAVTYLGSSEDGRVAGLISASGPLRLWERQRQNPERFARAEAMVREGRGQELLPPDAGGRVTSAQALVNRVRFGLDPYGFDDASQSEPPLARVRCPLLFVLGSEEPEIGRKSDLPRLKANARAAATAEYVYVEGANHVYQEHETSVADSIGDWLERSVAE